MNLEGTDYIVEDVNQEHGFVTTRDGSPVDFPRFPRGDRVRVWPVHSCLTAAAYREAHVIQEGEVIGTWDRCGGW